MDAPECERRDYGGRVRCCMRSSRLWRLSTQVKCLLARYELKPSFIDLVS